MVPRKPSRRTGEVIIKWLLFSCALVSILTTVGIVVSLSVQAWGFFVEVSPFEFLTGARWSPILKPRSYGVLPLVAGTLLVTGVAALVAMPIGLATATFLSEYAPDKVRRVLKPILEILAGIPTVVYGYFALTFVTPLIQDILFPDMLVFNALSAGIVMGLMIVPMVSTLSEDAMLAVPRSLREAAYALGATRVEVSLRIVIPAALSGIVAAFIIGLSRAIRRDHACDHRRGGNPEAHLQRAGEHPDHDGVHSTGGPGRGASRLRRVQRHIRGRVASIRDDPLHEPAGALGGEALEA